MAEGRDRFTWPIAEARVFDAVIWRIDASIDDTGQDAWYARDFRKVAGRVALTELVAQLAGVEHGDVEITGRCPDCGGSHGRPVVREPRGARSFGVSRTYAATSPIVAVRTGGAVGVDAESRVGMPAARLEAIRALRPGCDGDALREWTRVEAVLKADGRGLRVDPAAVRLTPLTSSAAQATVDGDPRVYEVSEVALGSDLVVSVALQIVPTRG